MATKSKKETKREAVTRAYFEYWLLQNNPEYVKFCNEAQPLRSQSSIPDDKTGWIRSNMLKFGLWDKVGRRGAPYTKDGRKIIDPLPLVDPNKRIDWSGIESGNYDEEIISIMGLNLFKPAEAIDFGKRFNEPFVCVRVNLRYDKTEILHSISEMMDLFEKDKRVRPLSRDHVKKLPLYAQICDWRRPPQKTFREIANLLRIPISTARSIFYHTFEMIYGYRYRPELVKKMIVNKETLRKHCDNCPDRLTCKIPCPEIWPYIEQDRVERREVSLKDLAI